MPIVCYYFERLKSGGIRCPALPFLLLRILFDSFIHFFFSLNLITLSSSKQYPSLIFMSQGHLVMFGDIFWLSLFWAGVIGAVGIWWLKAMDAVNILRFIGVSPTEVIWAKGQQCCH